MRSELTDYGTVRRSSARQRGWVRRLLAVIQRHFDLNDGRRNFPRFVEGICARWLGSFLPWSFRHGGRPAYHPATYWGSTSSYLNRVTAPEAKITRLNEKIVTLRQEIQRLNRSNTQLMQTEDKQISLTDPDS